MQEYCVDFNIARELKENKFPQNCLCQWVECYSAYDKKLEWRFFNWKDKNDDINPQIDAPMSDEILKELPKNINNTYFLVIVNENDEYFILYESFQSGYKNLIEIADKKLSNALAKTYIELKKRKIY